MLGSSGRGILFRCGYLYLVCFRCLGHLDCVNKYVGTIHLGALVCTIHSTVVVLKSFIVRNTFIHLGKECVGIHA